MEQRYYNARRRCRCLQAKRGRLKLALGEKVAAVSRLAGSEQHPVKDGDLRRDFMHPPLPMVLNQANI